MECNLKRVGSLFSTKNRPSDVQVEVLLHHFYQKGLNPSASTGDKKTSNKHYFVFSTGCPHDHFPFT